MRISGRSEVGRYKPVRGTLEVTQSLKVILEDFMELTGTLKGVLTRFRGFPDPFQRKFWNRFNLQIGFRILQRVPWTLEGVSDDF